MITEYIKGRKKKIKQPEVQISFQKEINLFGNYINFHTSSTKKVIAVKIYNMCRNFKFFKINYMHTPIPNFMKFVYPEDKRKVVAITKNVVKEGKTIIHLGI